MAKHHNSGSSSSTIELVSFTIARIANFVPWLALKVDEVGSVVGFRRWYKMAGGTNSLAFASRKKLWQQVIIPRLKGDDLSVSVFEFGVAYGEASRWWLKQLPSKSLRFSGFDLFTGLPTAWRDLPEGAFNANGATPNIDDERVTWFVGDVGDKINEVNWTAHNGVKFFIFDLDLFLPSLDTWQVVEKNLRPGDLLYFDEAFDIDERLLLKNYLLPTNRFEILGVSPFGLALECKS
jgi:hypothetical protein